MNFKIVKHTFILGLGFYAFAYIGLARKNESSELPIKVPQDDKTSQRMEEKIAQEKAKADSKNSFFDAFRGATPQLQADEPIVFDEESQTMYAKGNVKIAEKLFEIDSDEIEYTPKESLAKAKGDVRISLEEIRLVANQAHIDTANDKISSDLMRLGHYPLYVQLEDVEADKSMFKANNAKIFYNEPAFASLNLQADNFLYDTESKLLEVEGVTLNVGSLPIMYFPDLSIEDPSIPPIDIHLRYGYSSDFGAFGQNTVLYNAFESISPGALFDFYTSRGVLFGPAADFDYKSSSTRIWGTLRTGYIKDLGSTSELGYDTLGKAIGDDRGFIDLDFKQTIGNNIEITALLNYWSDSEVLRDFRENLFDEDQVPDNFVEINYFGEDYIGSVFARFEPNNWEDVQQRLPEISFNYLPVNLFNLGVYQNTYASYVNLREYSSDENKYLSSTRFDAYYGLDMPIALNSWSTFTPVVGARIAYYNDTTNGGDCTRTFAQIGFDANMNAWGTWDIESDSLDLNGLRHNLRPMMMYRYIPASTQGNSSIYTVDESVFSTTPDMLDLALSRDLDTLDDINTLRLGLENTFYTRADGYGSRKIASLNFYQDINFTEQKVYSNAVDYEYSNYSNFFAGLDIFPAEWLNFGIYTRTDIDNANLNQADMYIRLYDGDSASIAFTTNYMDDSINQYWVSASYKITEKYKVWARWKYDAELSELTDQVYSLSTRIGNSWNIEYQFRFTNGSSRDDGFSFYVLFGLVGF